MIQITRSIITNRGYTFAALAIAVGMVAALLFGLGALRASSPSQSRAAQADWQASQSLDEARQYVGFDIRTPREFPSGWRFQGVLSNKDQLRTGQIQIATLTYKGPSDGQSLQVVESPGNISVGTIPETQVTKATVQGVEATIYTNPIRPQLMIVSWTKDGMNLQATALLTEGFGRNELMNVLESIR